VGFTLLTQSFATLCPVTRLALIIILVLTAFGVVFALLPGRKQELRDQVTLSGITMVLYPQADPNARWTFEAERVVYNPQTQESLVEAPKTGKRWVKSTTTSPERLDLELRAPDLTIDAGDNLRTQQAKVFVYDGCYYLNLGKTGASPVLIQQSSGYQAPSVRMVSPSIDFTGDEFVYSFDLSSGRIQKPKATITDEAVKSCDEVQRLFRRD
jgi:hypothetical protein